MAAETAPAISPQERAILAEMRAELAKIEERYAIRAYNLERAGVTRQAAERLEALPPEAQSDGAAS
jgi:hypothetical protein